MLLIIMAPLIQASCSEALKEQIPVSIPQAVVPEEESVLQRDLPRPLEHHLHDLIKLTTKVLVK